MTVQHDVTQPLPLDMVGVCFVGDGGGGGGMGIGVGVEAGCPYGWSLNKKGSYVRRDFSMVSVDVKQH